MTKTCPRCKITKDINDFSRSRSTSDGRQVYCKACQVVYKKANWDKQKWYQLKSVYGLSKEDYDRMVAETGGVCPICNRPPSKKGWVVDHDHATGEVRGLLCQACNVALGLFSDDPERLEKAASYLRRTHCQGR